MVRAIFISTPHRGSSMADSWIGGFAQSLIRLPNELQNGFAEVDQANTGVTTTEGAAFFKQLNFTSVHTLSPRNPTLLAAARLPIAVPFHNIIGQKHDGGASDGVVAYSSAHLGGASSELIVRSGHNAFNNPEAQREVIRILREELGRGPARKPRNSTMLADYAE
ncbi:MAG TPA: hypothetical protein VJU77_00525 [Chthoniobacterales bacterium]|nr:hypothetical protein [Chthoniobacterales bacterium]